MHVCRRPWDPGLVWHVSVVSCVRRCPTLVSVNPSPPGNGSTRASRAGDDVRGSHDRSRHRRIKPLHTAVVCDPKPISCTSAINCRDRTNSFLKEDLSRQLPACSSTATARRGGRPSTRGWPESTELSPMTMPTASKRLSDARARSGPLVEAGGSNDETLCIWTNA